MSVLRFIQEKLGRPGLNDPAMVARRRQDELRRANTERLEKYARMMRAYRGYAVRGDLGSTRVSQWKRVKFNFVDPVVNLSAGWFAAKPIEWTVDGDPEATAAAYGVWSRSGGERALLENAICCGIYGDVVGMATEDEAKKQRIEFVDPCICDPAFDGADYSRLATLEVAYEALRPDGATEIRREMYGPAGMQTYDGDSLLSEAAYDAMPAVWIRNSAVKGVPFGISDVEPILDLVEEYDHLASKQTRIVDYYASPTIVFSGLQKGDSEKKVGTTFYLPTDAKAYFLEWTGNTPDVKEQLTLVRNAIAEISQVPAVAFGQADSGLTSVSGVAMQILYGPLITKTRRKQANWGPALEYLMWLCLRASGYKGLSQEEVHVTFPSATPVDGQAAIAEATAAIGARISSRRREMVNRGVEDPNEELKRIVIEEKILQLATPIGAIEQDANTSAKAGAKGLYSAQVPEGVGANGGPDQGAAAGGAAPQVADVTGANDDDIAHVLERIDAILDAESASIESAE